MIIIAIIIAIIIFALLSDFFRGSSAPHHVPGELTRRIRCRVPTKDTIVTVK